MPNLVLIDIVTSSLLDENALLREIASWFISSYLPTRLSPATVKLVQSIVILIIAHPRRIIILMRVHF